MSEKRNDIQEVLLTIMKQHGFTPEGIEAERMAKRRANGGFDNQMMPEFAGSSEPGFKSESRPKG